MSEKASDFNPFAGIYITGGWTKDCGVGITVICECGEMFYEFGLRTDVDRRLAERQTAHQCPRKSISPPTEP